MKLLAATTAASIALLALMAPVDGRAQCPSPPTLIGAITPPPGASGGDYVSAFLGASDAYYTDTAPTLEQIPPELDCAHWIKTRNADANAWDASFLVFDVLEPVEVYVLYDSRVAAQVDRSPPDWLVNDFEFTGIMVDVDDSTAGANDGDKELVVYRKSFPAGSVSLGANAATGADFTSGGNTESSQYLVAVTRPGPPVPTPGCPAPPSLISNIVPPAICDPPCSYVTANLGPGDEYYTDRGATHTLARLAPEVACAEWIKTQNDDKEEPDLDRPRFDISEDAVVYVLYDTRLALQGAALPSWLTSGFTYTHRFVDLTESDPDQDFILYAQSFPAGTVTLGGNKAPPAVLGGSNSNYSIAVVPDSDSDGVPDTVDNCPDVSNPVQRDADRDGTGDVCDGCTLVDDPGQTGWDGLGPPPDFSACVLPIEDGLSFSDLRAKDDHLFVVELENFPLRPEIEAIVTPTSAGSINFFRVWACNADSIAPQLYNVPSPGNGFSGGGNTEPFIWKGYSSIASRAGTRCILGIDADPASNATFDLDLDVLATQPGADVRNYDPVAGTFTAASEDFSTEGTNHRWIYPGTTGVGQCQPPVLSDALENPGETNEGPAEASYLEETVPDPNDVFDCCTWTFDSVDGVRAIPAVVEFPVGTPTVALTDSDGDFFPDRCDVCPNVIDIQLDEDGDLVGTVCDSNDASPNECRDEDADGCDDCAAGSGPIPGGDGLDTDMDGTCDNSDADGIPDDGDGSFVAGDATCTGGNTVLCDDNCPQLDNPSQDDPDADGVGTGCDNCPAIFNPGQDPALCAPPIPALSGRGLALLATLMVVAALALPRLRRTG